MRTRQLHDSVLQKYFTNFIGDSNPELPSKFQSTHYSKFVSPAKREAAQSAIEKVNASLSKPVPTKSNDEVRHLIESNPEDAPVPTSKSKSASSSPLDFMEYVSSQTEENEERRQLVFNRLCELQKPRQKPPTNDSSTSPYLYELITEIRRIQAQKLPIRVLFYKTGNPQVLNKLLVLNVKLKPLLERLFTYVCNREPTDPNQITLELIRLRNVPSFEGVPTEKLLSLMMENIRDVLSQQRNLVLTLGQQLLLRDR